MIQVEHLTKTYGSTRAVHDLDFSVQKGEIVGFLGPNGAGKTTTMRILTGSLGATGGRALINGIDVFKNPREVKRIVGYLPEFPPLYTDMTVRSFLRFCARVKGADRPKEAVERVIEQVGLGPVAHRIIEHLSKGFRQRVGIAQALVHSPQVLIVSKGRIVAQDTVEGLASAGAGVALRVSRPGPELAERLRAIEGVREVDETEPGHYRVEAAGDLREQVARVAVDFGLLELGSHRRLEDVFLQLTSDPIGEARA